MKTINQTKILALAAVMFLVTGCGDFLDTSLDNQRTDETIVTDRSTIWSFGNAMYAQLPNGLRIIDGNFFAAATDEGQQTASSADAFTFNLGILTPTSNPLWGRYTAAYEGIRAANFFLDYVSDGKGEALLALNRDLVADVVNYERDLLYLGYTIAEAYVVKAYYYGELVKMYGGVPIVDELYAEGQYVQKSSYDDVVAHIVKMIDDNKDKLAVNWSADTGRGGRFTLGVALAIKARALLYAASPLNNPTNDKDKWLAAARTAKELMDTPGLTDKGTSYALHADYAEYFKGSTPLGSAETIYAMRSYTSNDMETKNYPIGTPGGSSGVTPTHNLVSAYEYLIGFNENTDPNEPYVGRDPRLDATIVYNGSTWNGHTIAMEKGGDNDQDATNASQTGYYIKKYLTDGLNLVQDQTAQHNWALFRYAEVLLTYAEALNEAYGPDYTDAEFTVSARAALKQVRDRASIGLPAVTATGQVDFTKAIKRERMVEFAFEDHRYWDLLRWKDAEIVLNQPVKGVRVALSGGLYTYTEKEVASRTFDASKNYLLPFSRTEVANSKGSLTQNPNY